MSDEYIEDITPQEENVEQAEGGTMSLDGMFKDYWIDYASDVILDRSVPDIDDGLKPVQRRILHAMKETDDGRFTKVANIVGNTMQYHPHGDMSIKDGRCRRRPLHRSAPVEIHQGRGVQPQDHAMEAQL